MASPRSRRVSSKRSSSPPRSAPASASTSNPEIEPLSGTSTRQRYARGEGDKLRLDLLDAATDLMVTHGDLDSISLRAVARRAGVSPTAVYRHFDDHVDLLHEAVAASWASFIGVLTEARSTSADPFVQFRAMGDAYITFAMERPGRYRVLFSNKVDLAELGEAGDANGARGADSPTGEGAFELLVATVSDMLQSRGDHRDPVFVAVQVHTWIHGIVDLCGSHPEMPWPSTGDLLDGLSEALRLQP